MVNPLPFADSESSAHLNRASDGDCGIWNLESVISSGRIILSVSNCMGDNLTVQNPLAVNPFVSSLVRVSVYIEREYILLRPVNRDPAL